MVLLVALLPVIALLLFIYFVDRYQHEPWSQILKGVGLGALSALVVVTFLMMLNISFNPYSMVGALGDAFVNAAIPEEAGKLLMLWLLLRNNKYYDEYFDGIVYAVCVGLGFAGLENIVYLIEDPDWVQIGIARGLLSVPAHFLFAVAMGYYYSLVHYQCHTTENEARFNKLCVIGVPVLLHGSYDACLMVMQASLADHPEVSALCAVGFIATCVFMAVFAFKKCRRLLAADKAYFDQLAQQQMATYWNEQQDQPQAQQPNPSQPAGYWDGQQNQSPINGYWNNQQSQQPASGYWDNQQ